MNITIEDLFAAGVHFGHQLRRWNPKSKPFVYDHRGGVTIIDLEKTFEQLSKAYQALQEIVANGGEILFVGTKRQAQDVVRETAASVHMPFCANRWLGGTLTNFSTIQKSLDKYKRFLKMESDGTFDKMPNKEVAAIRREMSRMNRNFEGLLETTQLPKALIVVDIKNEDIAVTEAKRLGIPVIGIVDTNSDPTLVDYPIPANDDAGKSIRILLEVLSEGIQSGLANRDSKAASKQVNKSRSAVNESHAEVTISSDIDLEKSGSEGL